MIFIRYAVSKYIYWLGVFSSFIESVFRRKFNLKTIGKSSISFEFLDLFCEECFMAMINNFGITNHRSELKIKIVALPEKRAKLINVIENYAK